LNQISTIHKKESTTSFSSDSEKADTVDNEKDFDRHKTVLMPFGTPKIPTLFSKRTFFDESEIIKEDDEIEERLDKKVKTPNIKKILKRKKFMVCKYYSNKKFDNIKKKIGNKSNLLALKKNFSSSTKPSEVSKNVAQYIKSVSPKPVSRNILASGENTDFRSFDKKNNFRITNNKKKIRKTRNRIFSMDKIHKK